MKKTFMLLGIAACIILAACSSESSHSEVKAANVPAGPSDLEHQLAPLRDDHSVTLSSEQKSYAFASVKWDNVIYRITAETVLNVSEKLGEIAERHSEERLEEGARSSNTFPAGTEVWSIPGTSPSAALAVKSGNSYVKIVADTP
ncbi:hypothetical protein [Paenibacillus protaetiae]|uniref:Uncharacterized protein n=1 Tax=Paenibacillus protaetiae TaxID=2509456 RepID=A0A4P6EVA2_9BACL|nr:hypothetical protein [Paenibacillus protaetiae]QAY66952.1 hypothetical protein ET464_11660 [Paenibacillus protaetiae]